MRTEPGNVRFIRIFFNSIVLAFVLAACGGGSGSSGAGSSSIQPSCSTGCVASYTVGGTIAGLSGSVVLQDNGGDNLTVSANGAFSFATKIAGGGTYNVTILSQPAGQICAVSGGTGTVSANVSSVSVSCTATYSIGGNVSGLTGSVVLQDNGGSNLIVPASGPFTFATKILSGGAYKVTVLSPPTGQTCTVTGGTGTATANVTTVTVTCSTNTYTIGGTLTGLTGSVTLQNNGLDNLTAAANGTFTFATPLANGTSYNVTVLTPPTGESCAITGGTGTVTGGNIASVGVNCYSTGGPSLALFAGNMTGPGSIDGTGSAARFNLPGGGATDSAGNVYVADVGNHTIRKITPSGVVTTLAGSAGLCGSTDGTGPGALFCFSSMGNNFSGVAVDSAGNVYVADTANNTIRKVTQGGAVTTFAGTPSVAGGHADGTGAAASFNYPIGMATDSAGNVYVGDSGNNIIRRITPGGVVTTLAGTSGVTGSADGTGPAASFNGPAGVATDSAGNVYVADTMNYTIRMITPAGAVTTLAGTAGKLGSANGTGAAASFNFPHAVATDSAGNVYVADGLNMIRMITPSAVVSTFAGSSMSGSADGTGTAASFSSPGGVATDSTGNVYVSDTGNNTMRKITPAAVVTTLAGTAPVRGSANGTGAAATFVNLNGAAADSAGNVYVSDANQTIRKITPAGATTTLASLLSGFSNPMGVATDTAGNIYVADFGNKIILKITPAGVVSTLAGTAGVQGSADGTGPAASFNYPTGVATDTAGNVYVADSGNYTIRMITPAGVVTTLAGTAGARGTANGTGAAARFMSPYGIACDSAGNLYVSDQGSNTIRMITPAAAVTTLAGTAGVTGSADGTGATASFNTPSHLAVSAAGNVYVADKGSSTIRKITPLGAVTTVAGVAGQAGFIPGALPGGLQYPRAVAIGGTSLYVTTIFGVAVVSNFP